MNIFGKYVSVAVLVGFVVSVVTAVGGGIVTIINGWGTKDWDSMPANTEAGPK